MRKAALFMFVHLGLWEGMHTGAWRLPDAIPNPALDFERIKRVAQTAERGKLHGFFFSDILALPDHYSPEALAYTVEAEGYEPLTLCAALAATTSRIGFALTGNTTYNEPYHLARKFASLDHLSGGRVAWNIVAGGNRTEARNFGQGEHIDHHERYARAQEFYDVVTGLWDSWDDDAFIRDKASGVYFDVEGLHPLHHRGEYFSVDGPLTIPRPVQGYPVIAQAGSSAEGLDFATKVGELLFHSPQHDLEQGRTYYADVKARVAAHGRDPDDVLVIPGLVFVIRESQAEAEEVLATLETFSDPRVGLKRLAFMIDFDLSDYPLDGPVPEIPVTTVGSKALQALYVDRARKENLTVRQLAQLALSSGTVAATPLAIADRIEEGVTTGAADGYYITVAEARTLDLFVEHVVPELQRRGIFHDDYEGPTLRENLGLRRPANSRTRRGAAGAV